MTIDVDQAPILKAMIRTSYSGVIQRTLIHYVLLDLGEIASSMKITTRAHLTIYDKLALVDQQLKSEQVKRALCAGLDMNVRRRGDIVAEITTQYGLSIKGDEADFYHEHMEEILIEKAKEVETLIMLGDYNTLRHLASQTEQP